MDGYGSADGLAAGRTEAEPDLRRPDGNGRVLAVNVGRTVAADWAGRSGRTAIDKRPVDGPVEVRPLGLAGDEQADLVDHGGEFAAVYAYAAEDAAFWAAEIGRELVPGAFGENLTTLGVDASGAVVGERWRVGDLFVQVTGPRQPCRTFAGFWGVPHLVRRFTAAGRPGAYLRVERPGTVSRGDAVEVLDRPDHGVRVRDLLMARGPEVRALKRRVADAGVLPGGWGSWAGLDPTA